MYSGVPILPFARVEQIIVCRDVAVVRKRCLNSWNLPAVQAWIQSPLSPCSYDAQGARRYPVEFATHQPEQKTAWVRMRAHDRHHDHKLARARGSDANCIARDVQTIFEHAAPFERVRTSLPTKSALAPIATRPATGAPKRVPTFPGVVHMIQLQRVHASDLSTCSANVRFQRRGILLI